jgi:hypothetical protein
MNQKTKLSRQAVAALDAIREHEIEIRVLERLLQRHKDRREIMVKNYRDINKKLDAL